MPSRRGLVPFLALLVGVLLILAGFWSIGAYIDTLIEVRDSSDRSAAYWYLVLLPIGGSLIALGIYFVVLARRTWRRDPRSVTLARRSLVALMAATAALVVISTLRNKQIERSREESVRADYRHRDLEREARKLLDQQIDVIGNARIRIRNSASGGLDGTYLWTLTVFSDQATFLEVSRSLSLKGPASGIHHEIELADIFAACQTTLDGSSAYACVENAAAGETYTVQTELRLIEESHDTPIMSILATTLQIDTFTTRDRVIVQRIQPLPAE